MIWQEVRRMFLFGRNADRISEVTVWSSVFEGKFPQDRPQKRHSCAPTNQMSSHPGNHGLMFQAALSFCAPCLVLSGWLRFQALELHSCGWQPVVHRFGGGRGHDPPKNLNISKFLGPFLCSAAHYFSLLAMLWEATLPEIDGLVSFSDGVS